MKIYLKYHVLPDIIGKWLCHWAPDGSLIPEAVYLQANNAPAHYKEEALANIVQGIPKVLDFFEK